MTEEVKKLIESVERYDWEEGRMLKDKTGIYIEFDELLWIVGELTKWTKVEDGLPEKIIDKGNPCDKYRAYLVKGTYFNVEFVKIAQYVCYGEDNWQFLTDINVIEWKYIN